MNLAKTISVVSSLALSVPVTSHAQSEISGIASVIDGDTIIIHENRIRLYAIDAIESRQRCYLQNGKIWRCGTDSANAMAKKIGHSPVSCRVNDVDRYRRYVAKCYQNGEDLNAWLVENGWAVAYRRYGRDYVKQEEHARKEQRGIWASQFEMPWDWRRKN